MRLNIKGKKLKISSKEFHAALAAEGIPVGLGYIHKPIFEYEVLKDKKTYGKTHCPFDCEKSGKKDVRYRADDYPNTYWALSHWLCMGWNEGLTESDVDDIAEAIRKVATLLPKPK